MTRPHLRRPQWTRRAGPTAAPRAHRRPRWRVIVPVLAVLVVLLAAGAWVGSRAWSAKGELEQAQGLVTVLKDQVAAGDYSTAPDVFGEIRLHVDNARRFSGDPLWGAAEHVPVAGPNLRALRELTAVVDDTMTAGTPLVGLATDLSPATLAPHDGAVSLTPFVQAGPVVTTAAADLTALRARLVAVSTAGTVHQLRAAKTTLVDALDSASTTLTEAAPIINALPAILGANGPRTYVVMFLNNAELRSLGGTALSFAEITVDHGAITLGRVAPTSAGDFHIHDIPVIPVQAGFESLYPKALGYFVAEATLRPSAVTAAEIVQAEWKATFGEKIDGVISMDGGALSLLLKAVGPVTITTGDVVSSTNVQSLLFNEVYSRYNTGNHALDDVNQNLVYSETVTATFAKLTSGKFDPVVLFDSLRRAAQERNLAVWLTDTAEQSVIAATPFAAKGLPESTATKDVVGVYLNDQTGGKFNYYLESTLTTGSAMCTTDGRQVHRVSLALTNGLKPSAVAGLSESETGILYKHLGLEKGADRYIVFVYLPNGATLLSASIDGAPVVATIGDDDGHPVEVMWITIPPGATGNLSVDVEMGAPGTRALQVDVTPTVKGTKKVMAPLDCSTVKLP